MATQSQIDANRMNARKSTGPRTEAGKEQVRRNALKHGLRAEMIRVLPHEDAAEFARRFNLLCDEFRPRTEGEMLLVENATALAWKITRADRYETFHLSRRVSEAAATVPDGDPQGVFEEASLAAFDASDDGERLRRYQFTLLRELRRTFDALKKLRADNAKHGVKAGEPAVTRPTEPFPPVATPPQPSAPSQPPRPTPRDRHNPASWASSRPRPVAPNKANFGRPKGSNRPRPTIILDGDPGPDGVNRTPLDLISCLKS